jgi:2-oxoglutarate dehydrogenase E1 component
MQNNAEYLEFLYQQFKENPHALDEAWRSYFANSEQPSAAAAITDNSAVSTWCKMFYRRLREQGHRYANINPLAAPEPLPWVMPDAMMQQARATMCSWEGFEHLSFKAAYDKLQAIYTGTVGIEYHHTPHQAWLTAYVEHGRRTYSPAKRVAILKHLIAAEGLEHYLGKRYTGQKRFSLEGCDAYVAGLRESIHAGARLGVQTLVIGMAHRGRLNTWINILGKPFSEFFALFEGAYDTSRSGDVKYHLGYETQCLIDNTPITVKLACNPSHLEAVNPVVMGMARAYQVSQGMDAVVPILIHGDAAFTGQGVVMELINYAKLPGYDVGGTLHVVLNNQIGFTTDPQQGRSTPYCTDLAKMVNMPVLHVNADDPEAVVWCMTLAMDYRRRFKSDIMVDIIGYRRHGHNEADEPAMTQPAMYANIRQHPTVLKRFTQTLLSENVITEKDITQFKADYQTAMTIDTLPDWPLTTDGISQPVINVLPDTTFNETFLANIGMSLFNEPLGLQTQVAKELTMRRQMMANTLPCHWGAAECLAYGALLSEGFSIRLSGQDVGRGTFSHRHAVLHTPEVTLTPLSVLAQQYNVSCDVINSPLSEFGTVGFEYGYSVINPNTLVVWEAQFGDFANGAQIIIDQFIASGEQKWGQTAGLVLLLPHGYEGMGPEHSSARIERFLQLSAQHNWTVCIPTTPAQCFHVLRKQMTYAQRQPLVLFTPKSLLRHPKVLSTLSELSTGSFQPILCDHVSGTTHYRRIIICCGKIYYDLQDIAKQHQDVCLIRLEQLYPFPAQALQALNLHADTWVWCQEEPANQGAWTFVRRQWSMSKAFNHLNLGYVGRMDAASPATGYLSTHKAEQSAILQEAFFS